MLYNLDWLQPQKRFPPASEQERLERYESNLTIFNGDQWALAEIYAPYFSRIKSVVCNADAEISFPTLLNYQRLISMKMADLVCGDPPTVTGASNEDSTKLTAIKDDSNFLQKLYATVIDMSRYGDAVWRVYKHPNGKNTFTLWNPKQWYPIVSQDGTNTIEKHVLCWVKNVGTEEYPELQLHSQIHDVGSYDYRVFRMDVNTGHIGEQIFSSRVPTGLKENAVINIRAFETSDTVYGTDDYLAIDSILAEIMVRLAQISAILDKHADPTMTGPTSMLKPDLATGQYRLTMGSFFAVSPGEDQPKYLTWEGQLTAAFEQLELLLNQLFILSEIGASLFGAENGGEAISGAAMRFKMVSPLAKARRITNSLALKIKKLFELLSQFGYEKKFLGSEVSIEWSDGLPEDPRENAELVKLLTGRKEIMPLESAIIEYFGRTPEEASRWVEEIMAETEKFGALAQKMNVSADPNKPGPQDGTGVNPQEKGSTTGLKGFKSPTNK